MRILLDQGAGRMAAVASRAAGLEASHVADHGLSSALDEILDLARANGSVVVTFDGDFHELLALAGASSPSVIFVRDDDGALGESFEDEAAGVALLGRGLKLRVGVDLAASRRAIC